MKILCKLFGHEPNHGYGHSVGNGYFKVYASTTDGIGRVHLFLEATCERCNEKYPIGNVHVPTEYVK